MFWIRIAPGTRYTRDCRDDYTRNGKCLRGLSGLNLVSADVVEVSPAYDHAEVTSLAAATIVYELTNLFAKS
jgi:arginase family enzyme